MYFHPPLVLSDVVAVCSFVTLDYFSGGGMVSESDVKVPRKQLKPSAESSSKKPPSDHTPPKKKIPKVSHSKERKSEPEKAKSSGEHRSSTPDIKIKKVSKPHKQSLEKNKLSSFLAEIAGDQESSDDDRPPPKKHGTPSSSDRKKEKTRSKPSHKSSKSLLQEKEKRSSKARAESFLEFEELNLKKIKQEKIKETKTAQPDPKKSKPNKPSKPDNPAKAVSKDPPLSPLSSDIDSDADIDPDEWFKKEAARTERKRQAERKRESSVKVEVKTEIKEEKLEKVEVKKEPKPEPDQPLQYVKKELFNESDSSIEEGACEKSPPPPPIAKPSPPVAKPSPPDIKPSPQALKPYPIAARPPSPLAAPPPPPPPQLATSVSRPQITATTLVHHTEPEMPRIPKIPKIQKDVPKVAKIPKIPKIKREIVPKKEVPDKKEVPVKKEVKKESRIEEKQRTVKDEDLEQGELPESSDHVQLSPFREIPSLEDEFRPDSKRRMTSESSTSSAGFIEQAPRPATPCEMTPEHLKFLLNVYNKLYKLNKLDRHEHFQTVVNCITDSRCKYDVNEEDFQFDLLTCDRETLIKINDTLS